MPPWKIPPINTERRCILDGDTPSLLVACAARVALIVLTALFSMAWYKVVKGECMWIPEITSDKWDISWYSTRKRCITSTDISTLRFVIVTYFVDGWISHARN